MIKNYIKTAWRSLARNKSYTVINISGLAIGTAACLLIFLIVQFETSFDSFHHQKDRTVRVFTEVRLPSGTHYDSGVPLPTAEALRTDYPGLQTAAIFKNTGQISVGQQKFTEPDLCFAGPSFFRVFDFGWLSGDPATALKEPNTAILTQATAEKYFGSWQAAIGKTLTYEQTHLLKVTGILQNMPANTDLDLKLVVSYATLKNTYFKQNLSDWGSNFSFSYCFAVLPANLSLGRFNADLAALVKKHKPAPLQKIGLTAIPLSEMHYDARAGVFSGRAFSKDLIAAIRLIGLFLLVIACVNFINLATAQAVNRSKEVGVRKVLGSNRGQLIWQFLSETGIITVLAVALATALAYAMLPALNQLLGIQLSRALIFAPPALAFLGALALGTTLLAGFYPALVLSGFNPVMALKNRLSAKNTGGISLRRALVVLQFGIAQVLVIGTLVIVSQMNYFKRTPLGFDKDAVVNVALPNDSLSQPKKEGLRNQLLQLPGIRAVSFSYGSPSDDGNWSSDFKFDHSSKKTDFSANLKWADPAYFSLYHLKFIAGRPYEKTSQVRGYVVNETLLKKLGIRHPEAAIGKTISLFDDPNKLAPIVGVVRDFHVNSLRKEMSAVIMGSWPDVYQNLDIKLQGGDGKRTLAAIEKLWNATFTEHVYSYTFLDDKIARFYSKEDQLSRLYQVFAAIAIFISCLGLYGLISFMAIQRTKEVGIRKTLGASAAHIVYLFSKEFTLLILAAFAVAAPLGYYFTQRWLQDFSYRITLGPGIFILAVLASIAIAWLTVGYKAITAALASPVKSLKSE